jgi:hypothetical protein
VIGGDRFAAALMSEITDPALKPLLDRSIIGNIDQWCDHDNLRMLIADWRSQVMGMYHIE